MTISTRNRARGLQKLPSFKYYNAPKWECTSTLQLKAAKITDHIKNNKQEDYVSSVMKTSFFIGKEKILGNRGLSTLIYFCT